MHRARTPKVSLHWSESGQENASDRLSLSLCFYTLSVRIGQKRYGTQRKTLSTRRIINSSKKRLKINSPKVFHVILGAFLR